jgi:hypothetical protein
MAVTRATRYRAPRLCHITVHADDKALAAQIAQNRRLLLGGTSVRHSSTLRKAQRFEITNIR